MEKGTEGKRDRMKNREREESMEHIIVAMMGIQDLMFDI